MPLCQMIRFVAARVNPLPILLVVVRVIPILVVQRETDIDRRTFAVAVTITVLTVQQRFLAEPALLVLEYFPNYLAKLS